MTSDDKRLILVVGGAGSGKSEFAENAAYEMYAQKLRSAANSKPRLYYLATMSAKDEESVRKIQKHIERRKDTEFETKELPVDIARLSVGKDDVILLECVSNLLANEMFGDAAGKSDTICGKAEKIIADISSLHAQCDMVIVSNEVSLDGCDYDEITRKYISELSRINREVAGMADRAVEVVAGIPVYIK